MDIFYSIVGFFSRGGVFMLPILFAAALGVAIAIERFITLTRMSVRNRGMWATLDPVLTNGEFDKAREMAGEGRHRDFAPDRRRTLVARCGAPS